MNDPYYYIYNKINNNLTKIKKNKYHKKIIQKMINIKKIKTKKNNLFKLINDIIIFEFSDDERRSYLNCLISCIHNKNKKISENGLYSILYYILNVNFEETEMINIVNRIFNEIYYYTKNNILNKDDFKKLYDKKKTNNIKDDTIKITYNQDNLNNLIEVNSEKEINYIPKFQKNVENILEKSLNLILILTKDYFYILINYLCKMQSKYNYEHIYLIYMICNNETLLIKSLNYIFYILNDVNIYKLSNNLTNILSLLYHFLYFNSKYIKNYAKNYFIFLFLTLYYILSIRQILYLLNNKNVFINNTIKKSIKNYIQLDENNIPAVTKIYNQEDNKLKENDKLKEDNKSIENNELKEDNKSIENNELKEDNKFIERNEYYSKGFKEIKKNENDYEEKIINDKINYIISDHNSYEEKINEINYIIENICLIDKSHFFNDYTIFNNKMIKTISKKEFNKKIYNNYVTNISVNNTLNCLNIIKRLLKINKKKNILKYYEEIKIDKLLYYKYSFEKGLVKGIYIFLKYNDCKKIFYYIRNVIESKNLNSIIISLIIISQIPITMKINENILTIIEPMIKILYNINKTYKHPIITKYVHISVRNFFIVFKKIFHFQKKKGIENNFLFINEFFLLNFLNSLLKIFQMNINILNYQDSNNISEYNINNLLPYNEKKSNQNVIFNSNHMSKNMKEECNQVIYTMDNININLEIDYTDQNTNTKNENNKENDKINSDSIKNDSKKKKIKINENLNIIHEYKNIHKNKYIVKETLKALKELCKYSIKYYPTNISRYYISILMLPKNILFYLNSNENTERIYISKILYELFKTLKKDKKKNIFFKYSNKFKKIYFYEIITYLFIHLVDKNISVSKHIWMALKELLKFKFSNNVKCVLMFFDKYLFSSDNVESNISKEKKINDKYLNNNIEKNIFYNTSNEKEKQVNILTIENEHVKDNFDMDENEMNNNITEKLKSKFKKKKSNEFKNNKKKKKINESNDENDIKITTEENKNQKINMYYYNILIEIFIPLIICIDTNTAYKKNIFKEIKKYLYLHNSISFSDIFTSTKSKNDHLYMIFFNHLKLNINNLNSIYRAYIILINSRMYYNNVMWNTQINLQSDFIRKVKEYEAKNTISRAEHVLFGNLTEYTQIKSAEQHSFNTNTNELNESNIFALNNIISNSVFNSLTDSLKYSYCILSSNDEFDFLKEVKKFKTNINLYLKILEYNDAIIYQSNEIAKENEEINMNYNKFNKNTVNSGMTNSCEHQLSEKNLQNISLKNNENIEQNLKVPFEDIIINNINIKKVKSKKEEEKQKVNIDIEYYSDKVFFLKMLQFSNKKNPIFNKPLFKYDSTYSYSINSELIDDNFCAFISSDEEENEENIENKENKEKIENEEIIENDKKIKIEEKNNIYIHNINEKINNYEIKNDIKKIKESNKNKTFLYHFNNLKKLNMNEHILYCAEMLKFLKKKPSDIFSTEEIKLIHFNQFFESSLLCSLIIIKFISMTLNYKNILKKSKYVEIKEKRVNDLNFKNEEKQKNNINNKDQYNKNIENNEDLDEEQKLNIHLISMSIKLEALSSSISKQLCSFLENDKSSLRFIIIRALSILSTLKPST